MTWLAHLLPGLPKLRVSRTCSQLDPRHAYDCPGASDYSPQHPGAMPDRLEHSKPTPGRPDPLKKKNAHFAKISENRAPSFATGLMWAASRNAFREFVDPWKKITLLYTFWSGGPGVPLIIIRTSEMRSSDDLRSELYTTFLSGYIR